MTVATPGLSKLFVYGTLMPGRLRWPMLEPFATAWRAAAVPGSIYDSGEGWPVAAFATGAHSCVPGQLVGLDPTRLDEALGALDEVEDTATDRLRRVEVVTVDGESAWAYHLAHSPDGLQQIERWDQQADR